MILKESWTQVAQGMVQPHKSLETSLAASVDVLAKISHAVSRLPTSAV